MVVGVNCTSKSRKIHRRNNKQVVQLDLGNLFRYLGLLCVLLVAFGGCVDDTRQQEVNVTANEIFDSLYVPPDAVLLDKVERSDALAYARDCTGTLIEAAYGIDQPLDEVMAEYNQRLLEAGWKPIPGWDTSQVEGFAVYQKNPQTRLDFNTDLTWTSLPNQDSGKIQFTTVYTILILYTEPSNRNCIG